MVNTGFLNTGMTSSSSEPKTPREKQKLEKEQNRIKLKPAADVVIELISNERNKVTDIRSFIDVEEVDPEQIKHELRARQLYLGYLNSLETKIKNVLKDEDKK